MNSCIRTALLFLVAAGMAVSDPRLPTARAEERKISNFFSMKKGMPWHKDDALKPRTPVRFVDSWTDTVLHRQGQPSQRGFGGRFHFYDEKGGKPILTEGQLVVYAFDETDRDPTDNRPNRRYVFPPDQFKLHMSESSLGPSYSFWLPWDQVGGEMKDISLICRFEPTKGAVVVGDQTRQRLPGTMIAVKPPSTTLSTAREEQMRQAGTHGTNDSGHALATYEQNVQSSAATEGTSGAHMNTTSISLPARPRRR